MLDLTNEMLRLLDEKCQLKDKWLNRALPAPDCSGVAATFELGTVHCSWRRVQLAKHLVRRGYEADC